MHRPSESVIAHSATQPAIVVTVMGLLSETPASWVLLVDQEMDAVADGLRLGEA